MKYYNNDREKHIDQNVFKKENKFFKGLMWAIPLSILMWIFILMGVFQ